METKIRREEFGRAPWSGVVLAVLLVVTLHFSLAQPNAHSRVPTAAAHTTIHSVR